uniref:Metalloendopeptidase n=1 Tax=Varanus komodoensis TaxID=61221 RepID=A0A8D2IRX6_VARKO
MKAAMDKAPHGPSSVPPAIILSVSQLPLPDHSSVQTIRKALDDFARFTCIKFVPYSYQRDFISIVPLAGCFSSVGRIGGMQVVSLAPSCLRKGKGVALHELMHVLGFCHEHSRADRDKYISISWKDILTGFEMNFMKSWNANMLADYDYSSVMHYSSNAFSMTGFPTITPLSGSHPLLGQRWNLSSSDIARVNKLYRCSQAAPWSRASSMGPMTAGGPHCTASASKSPPPAGEASAPALPSSSAVGRSQSAAQTRRIQPTGAEKPTQGMGSPAIPSKAEGSGKWVTSVAEVLPKARPRET